MPASPIDDEQAEFLTRGLSVCAASCSPARVPSVARALGCRLSADRRRITLMLSRRQAAALLADIEAGGRIAVTFVEPHTHRALQIKGTDAAVLPAEAGDAAACTELQRKFIANVQPMGFDPDLVATLLTYLPEEMIRIGFTPEAVFSQTPGPRAGERLGAAA